MARDPRHDVLFEPVVVGPRTLRNRFYQTPHSTGFGERPLAQAAFRATKAEGGWAGVNLELTSIDPEADREPMPTPAKLWDDTDVERVAILAEAVHAHGSIVGAELWHGGYNIVNSPSRLAPGGPSALPADHFPLTYSYAMSVAQIRRVRDLYVAAAHRAEAAGLDLVYAYGSHNYLPTQFLSPFSNHRDDEYGGSLRNRARFWLEIIEAIREAVGGRLVVAVRIGIDTSGHFGPTLDDVLGFVRMADDMVDLWDVNTAVIADHAIDMRPSRLAAQGYQVEWSGRVREATAKPIVGVSRLTDPDRMAEIIRSGAWDLIGGARPSIADPFLPAKIEAGRYDEIRECIGCNICLSRVITADQISCTQNPTAGEEHRRGWHPERMPRTSAPKRDVLVVGGGVAGMQCALTLARRGLRRVHLVERSPELGGYAALAASLPGLGEWSRLVDWRRTQLAKLRNVEIVTGTELGAADVRDYGADIVVLATGAEWRTDGLAPQTHAPLPGADAGRTLTPEQILAGAEPGERVVVYDCEGYFMGVGMAELLAARGHAVTLITPLGAVGPMLDLTFEGDHARRQILAHGGSFRTETEILSIDDGAVRTRWLYGGEWELAADTVVLVTARQPRTAMRAELPGAFAVGDCVAPRLLADCIFDGHRLAMEIDEPDPMVPVRVRREPRLVEAAPGSLAGDD